MNMQPLDQLTEETKLTFSPYQKLVILILALLQFTVVLDFMVLSPLGDILIKSLDISTTQFGIVVSSYAISAFVSGILTAGFADKFDRKKLLMFFYTGFVIGTLFCGLANNFAFLLLARIVTGLFGGVISSISMAIITDLFPIQQRGKVMGFTQMSFAASQILGIPIGIQLATLWGWHSTFFMIVILAIIIGLLIFLKLQPVSEHLKLQSDKNAFDHLLHTFSTKDYQVGYLVTAALSIGGFMLMPFGSAFLVNNVQISQNELKWVFMFSGIASVIVMPLIGKLSDKVDKLKIFAFGSIASVVMVLIYTNLPVLPLWQVTIINMLLMMSIFSRMIPSTAIITAIPDMKNRGAFMSINTSLQYLAGGIAAILAGLVVKQPTKTSPLEHYNTLGIIVSIVILSCIYLLYRANEVVKQKNA